MSTKEKHLYYLSELKDYKVNSKDPDIRGWAVKDLDNRVIGKVDNLLANKELGKVMYVDVEVDESIIDINHDPYAASPNSEFREFINKEGENHIIIPIGLIDLDMDNKHVFTESIDYQTFAETKRYRSGTTISRDYERHVLGSYDRRKEYLDKDHEVRRTRSAYTDAELEKRQRRNREENLERRSSDSEMDEKIRREKENLRYKSDDRKRPVEDRRNFHQSNTDELNPERTLNEDKDWERDDPRFEKDDAYRNRRQRKTYDDDFYDRREFYDRDHR